MDDSTVEAIESHKRTGLQWATDSYSQVGSPNKTAPGNVPSYKWISTKVWPYKSTILQVDIYISPSLEMDTYKSPVLQMDMYKKSNHKWTQVQSYKWTQNSHLTNGHEQKSHLTNGHIQKSNLTNGHLQVLKLQVNDVKRCLFNR